MIGKRNYISSLFALMPIEISSLRVPLSRSPMRFPIICQSSYSSALDIFENMSSSCLFSFHYLGPRRNIEESGCYLLLSVLDEVKMSSLCHHRIFVISMSVFFYESSFHIYHSISISQISSLIRDHRRLHQNEKSRSVDDDKLL